MKPDEDPLASYKADFVWESTDLAAPVTVYLQKPIKKPPANSLAAEHHGGDLKDYQFYSRISVINDQGNTYSWDLAEASNEVAVVEYGEDESGDAILVYADILGVYTKDGEPWIEHGYFYDRAEIVRDKAVKSFLKKTEKGRHGKIGKRELVNSLSVYHSPAEIVQSKASIWHGDQNSIPAESKRAFYWRRALDINSNKEASPDKIDKQMRLPRPFPHPANVLAG